jgi:hypothetical protein
MLEAEAIRIRDILLGAGDISPLLDLGSSTRRFREEAKPHIERELFGPLRRAGVEVVHCDLKQEDGVDVAGDIRDPAFREKLRNRGFRSVLVCNLLEHVRDRSAVAGACEEISGPGGLILATVPSSYPYHADPIDTLYRPSPAELEALFGRCEPLIVEQLAGPNLAEHLSALGISPWREAVGTISALLLSPFRPRRAAARLHRWLWYRRPWRVSIALVRVR